MKRFLICADVEGATGVGDEAMLSGDAFRRVREMITSDVNACARGIRRSEPDAAIDVFDAHGLGGNLLETELEPGVSLLGGGWVDILFPLVSAGKLADCDGLFLLGQHAANGTKDGFISHTNSEHTALRVNGLDAGEAEQLAWLAGAHGVPTLLVVGDDATEREARALLPDVRTVSVKTSIDRHSAECRPEGEVWDEIESVAAEATRSAPSIRPSTVDEPVQFVSFFSHPEMAIAAKPFRDVTVDESGFVRFQADTFVDGWFHHQAMARVCPQYGMYREAFRRLYKLEGAPDIAAELTKELSARPFAEDSAIPDVSY